MAEVFATHDCISEDDKSYAVSVTNLDKAVKWYQEVFGFNIINGPVEIVVDDSPLGVILKDIHGPNLKKMRIVWLSSGNQVGFEIFEYIDPIGNVIEIYTHGYEQTITSV